MKSEHPLRAASLGVVDIVFSVVAAAAPLGAAVGLGKVPGDAAAGIMLNGASCQLEGSR